MPKTQRYFKATKLKRIIKGSVEKTIKFKNIDLNYDFQPHKYLWQWGKNNQSS